MRSTTTPRYVASIILGVIVSQTLAQSPVQTVPPPRAVYWTDALDNAIWRCDLNGANRIRLIEGVPNARGIAVEGTTIYWVDRDQLAIKSANLDGSGIQTITAGGMSDTAALDVGDGWIIWAEDGPGRINRVRTDGTGRQVLFSGISRPRGIAIDNGFLYWSEIGTDRIRRSTLDGGEVTTIVSSGLRDTLEVDVHGDYLYWSDFGSDNIRRSRLDGSDIRTIQQFTVGTASPIGVEAHDDFVYWTDSFRDRIERKLSSGSGSVDILYSAARLPEALAVGQKCECGFDLAEPACVYDLNDVDAFVQEFLVQGPNADFAEPFGTLDLRDITAFIDGFLTGCR